MSWKNVVVLAVSVAIGFSQVPATPIQPPVLPANYKIGLAAAGVKARVLRLPVDPGNGRDILVLSSLKPVPLSIKTPAGLEIDSGNAASHGYSLLSGADAKQMARTGLTTGLGQEVVFVLPAGSAAGNYEVWADATALAEALPIELVYISTSNIAATLATDQETYAVGDRVPISLALLDGQMPVAAGTITASIARMRTLTSQITVAGYRTQSSVTLPSGRLRVSYLVDIANAGPDFNNVSGTAAGGGPDVAIVVPTVFFGTILAGGTASNVVPIVVEMPSGSSFDPAALSWEFGAPAAPAVLTLADSGPDDAQPGDGLYSGAYVPTVVGEYEIAARVTGMTAGGLSFERFARRSFSVDAPLAKILSVSEAIGTDGLRVAVNVDVTRVGRYVLRVQLATASENTEESATKSLVVGAQTMEVFFPWASLRYLKADGPYERKRIHLNFTPANAPQRFADAKVDFGQTVAVSVPALAPARFRFEGAPTWTTVDSNGVAGVERLDLTVPFVISGPPTSSCTLLATVYDKDGGAHMPLQVDGVVPRGLTSLRFEIPGSALISVAAKLPLIVRDLSLRCHPDVDIWSDKAISFPANMASLVFEGALEDLKISLHASTIAIASGTKRAVSFDLQQVGSFRRTVAVTLAGIPSGVSATWTVQPTELTGRALGGFILENVSAAAGSYILRVNVNVAGTTQTVRLNVYIPSAPPVVDISPASTLLGRNDTLQLTATVAGLPSNDVYWRVGTPNGGSITPSGLYTAPSDVPFRLAVSVVAISLLDPLVAGVVEIVLDPPGPVTVSPAEYSLADGRQKAFRAYRYDTETSAVTWSVSPPAAGTVDAAGTFTASSGLTAPLAATITAVSTVDSSQVGSAAITIYPALPTAICQACELLPVTWTWNPAFRASQATFRIRNSGTTAINGPIQMNLILDGFPMGLRHISRSGVSNGVEYQTIADSDPLQPGAIAEVLVRLENPAQIEPVLHGEFRLGAYPIRVNPRSTAVASGASQQYTATQRWPSGTPAWQLRSGDPGTLSAVGLYTAPVPSPGGRFVQINVVGADRTQVATGLAVLPVVP